MKVRLKSGDDIIEIECDAYAIFDTDAGLVLVSDHTLIDGSEGFEVVWIV